MFKKLKTLLLVAMVSIGSVGCSTTKEKESQKVTLILSVGGVNDLSFNQSAWEGAVKAQEQLGVDVKYLESHSDSDYMSNIETAIEMDSDLVVGIGFQVGSAIKEAAEAYPEQDFAMVDSTYDNAEDIPDNVRPILFNEEQAGYLTGIIAGKMTETNVLGCIGGFDLPSLTPFFEGFERGAKEVNPDVKILRQYINSFTDAAKAKVAAQQMIKQENTDLVFMATGGGNSGIIEAAKETNKAIIGVDMPSSYLAPEYVVTSALKNVGEGLFLTIKDYVEGNYNGGHEVKYDISNGGVGYEQTKLIPQEIIDLVESKIEEMK